MVVAVLMLILMLPVPLPVLVLVLLLMQQLLLLLLLLLLLCRRCGAAVAVLVLVLVVAAAAAVVVLTRAVAKGGLMVVKLLKLVSTEGCSDGFRQMQACPMSHIHFAQLDRIMSMAPEPCKQRRTSMLASLQLLVKCFSFAYCGKGQA